MNVRQDQVVRGDAHAMTRAVWCWYVESCAACAHAVFGYSLAILSTAYGLADLGSPETLDRAPLMFEEARSRAMRPLCRTGSRLAKALEPPSQKLQAEPAA